MTQLSPSDPPLDIQANSLALSYNYTPSRTTSTPPPNAHPTTPTPLPTSHLHNVPHTPSLSLGVEKGSKGPAISLAAIKSPRALTDMSSRDVSPPVFRTPSTVYTPAPYFLDPP